MRTTLAACVVVACVSGFGARAEALDCGDRLVEVGDAQAYVLSVCGQPTSTAMRNETRTEWRTTGVAPHEVRTSVVVTVQVEVWIYDWGPERFMEELRFEGGVLVAERPMGPGTVRATRRTESGDDDGPGAVHHHRDAHGHRDAERSH